MSAVRTVFHSDPGEGKFHIERIQDVEDILDWNKAAQNEKQTYAGTWRHVGRIPNVVIEKWMNEFGVDVLRMSQEEFGQFIKRKLNDPDNRWLKTTDGRL
jgi:hypothetical protein